MRPDINFVANVAAENVAVENSVASQIFWLLPEALPPTDRFLLGPQHFRQYLRAFFGQRRSSSTSSEFSRSFHQIPGRPRILPDTFRRPLSIFAAFLRYFRAFPGKTSTSPDIPGHSLRCRSCPDFRGHFSTFPDTPTSPQNFRFHVNCARDACRKTIARRLVNTRRLNTATINIAPSTNEKVGVQSSLLQVSAGKRRGGKRRVFNSR